MRLSFCLLIVSQRNAAERELVRLASIMKRIRCTFPVLQELHLFDVLYPHYYPF